MRTASARLAKLALFGISILIGACAYAPASKADGATLNLDNYKMTFQEDFNTLDVSPWGRKRHTRWIAHTPWNGDFGDAKFSNPRHGFPFTLKNGILRIEARKGKDGKWHSGLLASTNPKGEGFSQKYGYFEARMKLPPGKGVWPAFWLVGLDRSHFTAEIDVIEYYGRDPTHIHSAWHIWRKKGEPGKSRKGVHLTEVPAGSLSDSFHTYGVDISPKKVTYYFDRKEVWQIDTPKEFNMPFYPLVDLGLGAGWPIDETPNPSFLSVDYIHVYQRKK
ncbi:MAG TPA: glycoside hydrolase family 16 protein [Pararhizobium sp.]|nr:glycoside hydrolase family 16 protein [Pararhizobium sp.]